MRTEPDVVTDGIDKLIRWRLLRGGGWALGGRVATSLVGLVSNALLARVLAPGDLGLFFIAFSIAGFGAIVGQLGLHQVAVRFVADSLGRGAPILAGRVAVRIVWWGTCGGFGVAALYLMFGRAIASSLFDSERLADVTLIIAGWIAVQTIQKLLAEVFRGFHDIRFATLFGGLATLGILALALSAVMVFDWNATLADAVGIAAGASLTAVVFAGVLFRRKLGRVGQDNPGPSRLPTLKTAAAPIFITSILNYAVLQGDIWIVGSFRPPDEVALYGAAAKLVVLVVIPLTMINAVMAPIIADLWSRRDTITLEKWLRGSAGVAAVPALIGIATLAAAGHWILGLLYGSYYAAAAPILIILAVGQGANVLAGSCQLSLMMAGRERLALAAATIGAATILVVGSIATKLGGVIGMALAVSLGVTLQNGASVILARRALGVCTHASFGLAARLVSARLP